MPCNVPLKKNERTGCIGLVPCNQRKPYESVQQRRRSEPNATHLPGRQLSEDLTQLLALVSSDGPSSPTCRCVPGSRAEGDEVSGGGWGGSGGEQPGEMGEEEGVLRGTQAGYHLGGRPQSTSKLR